MGMPLSRTDWTADMLDALPDGQRYEVIDGELFVTPAPRDIHQFAIGELHLLLAPYAKLAGIDRLFAPSAVRFSDRREVQPDLLARPRMPDGRRAARFADVGLCWPWKCCHPVRVARTDTTSVRCTRTRTCPTTGLSIRMRAASHTGRPQRRWRRCTRRRSCGSPFRRTSRSGLMSLHIFGACWGSDYTGRLPEGPLARAGDPLLSAARPKKTKRSATPASNDPAESATAAR